MSDTNRHPMTLSATRYILLIESLPKVLVRPSRTSAVPDTKNVNNVAYGDTKHTLAWMATVRTNAGRDRSAIISSKVSGT